MFWNDLATVVTVQMNITQLLRSDFASFMTANRTLTPKITAWKDLALKSTAFKAIAQYMTSED
jgi:hypothetical protein